MILKYFFLSFFCNVFSGCHWFSHNLNKNYSVNIIDLNQVWELSGMGWSMTFSSQVRISSFTSKDYKAFSLWCPPSERNIVTRRRKKLSSGICNPGTRPWVGIQPSTLCFKDRHSHHWTPLVKLKSNFLGQYVWKWGAQTTRGPVKSMDFWGPLNIPGEPCGGSGRVVIPLQLEHSSARRSQSPPDSHLHLCLLQVILVTHMF